MKKFLLKSVFATVMLVLGLSQLDRVHNMIFNPISIDQAVGRYISWLNEDTEDEEIFKGDGELKDSIKARAEKELDELAKHDNDIMYNPKTDKDVVKDNIKVEKEKQAEQEKKTRELIQQKLDEKEKKEKEEKIKENNLLEVEN